jgi:hypothetical protein
MRPVAAKKGVKNELPEIATADDWSDVGYVAPGWVWRSCSHAHTRPCGYRRGGGTDVHTNCDTNANPADVHTYANDSQTDS